jgi:hypothetical protein
MIKNINIIPLMITNLRETFYFHENVKFYEFLISKTIKYTYLY